MYSKQAPHINQLILHDTDCESVGKSMSKDRKVPSGKKLKWITGMIASLAVLLAALL